jgi:Flp pilus assembly protein TadG
MNRFLRVHRERLTAARLAGDRGSTTIELVILAPLFGLLLAFVMAAGRVQSGRADVDGAARAAARDISLARDPAGEVGAAQAAASTSLDVGEPHCRSMTFDAAVNDVQVVVTVTCRVDLSEAAVLPLPGSYSVTGSATEAIDQWVEGDR